MAGIRGGRSKVEGRPDPSARHIDGTAPWAILKNREDGAHYVYVSNLDAASQAHYRAAGYKPVVLETGGAQPIGGCTVKPGEAIEMMGCTLMVCSKDRYAQIVSDGPWGGSGQKEADRIMARIRGAGGADIDEEGQSIEGHKVPVGTRLVRQSAAEI